jgi:hypothetical protein
LIVVQLETANGQEDLGLYQTTGARRLRDAVAAWAREHVTVEAFTVDLSTVEEVGP